MISSQSTSYPSDLFMKSLRDAIQDSVQSEVEKAIEEAKERLHRRIPEIVATLAIQAHAAIKVDRFAPEIVLTIKWPEVEK